MSQITDHRNGRNNQIILILRSTENRPLRPSPARFAWHSEVAVAAVVGTV